MSETILWKRIDLQGHEICRLEFNNNKPSLSGTAIFLYEHRPCKIDYRVNCDSKWHTVETLVTGYIGNRPLDFRITKDRAGWIINGTIQPKLINCKDIDLGFSPSTNLLPIRRLALTAHERAEVNAAWLKFRKWFLNPFRKVIGGLMKQVLNTRPEMVLFKESYR